MQERNNISAEGSKNTPSREDLELHLRARAWKDDAFRQEFLTNPKAVLERDYAQYFPEGNVPSELSIKVIEEDEQAICFVLPPKLSDDQLSELESIDDEELLMASGGGTEVTVCCDGWTRGCSTFLGQTCKKCSIGCRIDGNNIGGIIGKARL